jgi:hypothetical protein
MNPNVPDAIHRRKVRYIGKINIRAQDLFLAAAGGLKKSIDFVENLTRLLVYRTRRVVGYLPRQENKAIGSHGL